MRTFRKTMITASSLAAATSVLTIAGMGAAHAAATTVAPHLDGPGYVSHSAGCTVGVTQHHVYKWVPDSAGAGSTQWSTDDFEANTKAMLPGKTGTPVSYHRDGTKSSWAYDQTCGVDAKSLFRVNPDGSVTLLLVPGIETRLYGVNGYPQENPITADTTVTGGTEGTFGTAPQFWIGYTAQPGYVLEGQAPWHVDFYNGDDILDSPPTVQ